MIMFLGYLIQNAVISVEKIGVVPWSLFLWVIWLILHTCYKKCFQIFLHKIKVNEIEQDRLIKVYWTLVFTAITIPFAFQNLSLTLQDVREKFKFILENQLYNWFNTNNNFISIQTKLSYVLLTGFYLNSVCEISIEKGFNNIDFFHSECLTIFFVCTLPARCVLYGIALTSFVNFVRCILEVCKFLTSVSNIVGSKLLRKLAFGTLIIHSFIWCVIFLHILPKYFLILTINKLKQKTDITYLSVFSLLNISLWGFYILEIYKSPITCCITNYIFGKSINFEEILFGYNDNKINEEFDQDDIDCIEPVQISEFTKEKCNNFNGTNKQTKENLMALYQTVKCVIRVKRKLKRIREKLKKSQIDENSTQDAKGLITSCT